MALWTESPQLFQTAVPSYWYSLKCMRLLGSSDDSIDDDYGDDDGLYGDVYPNHYEVTREAILAAKSAQNRLALGLRLKIKEATC